MVQRSSRNDVEYVTTVTIAGDRYWITSSARGQQRFRDCEAERFGGLEIEIDDHLDLDWGWGWGYPLP
jgi:hypothetical protein